jgi:hypothetical protein
MPQDLAKPKLKEAGDFSPASWFSYQYPLS